MFLAYDCPDCPKLTNCDVHVDCFQMTTTTISAPAIDACCMSTPTFRVPDPCPTCQTGCNTGTETVFTTAGAYPTLYRDSLSPTCTTTKMVLKQMHIGPTETVYTSAVTSTSMLACDGCALVTRNWAGIGPVAHFTTTVTATGATTTTTFVCTK